MTILSDAFYFIIALGILVTIHEFGHFWVARRLGVKVLTFSVGFGSPLWKKKGKDGVDYVIAMIPLGGYVKMLDEREGEVTEEDKPFAFNRKSVWARIAIVLAGPVANFLLAILLYWWVFLSGVVGVTTELGKIDSQSIAGKAGLKAGDRVVSIDEEPVVLYRDLNTGIVRRIGEKTEIILGIQKEGISQIRKVPLDISSWQVNPDRPDILGSLGLRLAVEDIVVLPLISEIEQGSPAEIAGLKIGDLIVAYDETNVESWQQLVVKITKDANKKVVLGILRDGEPLEISVVIGSHETEGSKNGFLGVRPESPDYSQYITSRKGGFFESLSMGIGETGKMIALSSRLFKKLIVGEISHKSVSGPFSIAKGAGGSARNGLVSFFFFVAMISVNLGFINLLPIPLLDGGHLLYYVIEAIKGKPLPESVQNFGLQVGMILVIMMMALAIFNDLAPK
ncbi:RIP metalloprotease RseP [Aliikangiella sp. G2MR2-5]|uniref:RIP metalloprotease RseP n=1 Tax=Aliikangiella sp. G2MR2-5 TaxID=2788943 RepID=UPI0018AA1B75|nr:RIP metalloprotease RseP [Aliikangiella sp. G2MR2-5]